VAPEDQPAVPVTLRRNWAFVAPRLR